MLKKLFNIIKRKKQKNEANIYMDLSLNDELYLDLDEELSLDLDDDIDSLLDEFDDDIDSLLDEFDDDFTPTTNKNLSYKMRFEK